VQATLQPGEAAIEFVHYRYYNKNTTDSTMYAALLLQPGIQHPQFIPLFEENALDSLLSFDNERKVDYVNRLYSTQERGIETQGPQKSLYDLIWQPLEEELEGVNTIYFTSSGLLHRLNLGAISIDEEKTVADEYQLVGLNSTRQLVIPTNVDLENQDAILYGDIQYEMDSTAIAKANIDYNSALLSSRGELTFQYSDPNERIGGWNSLKWTEKEVETISSTLENAGFTPNLRTGYKATEESFRSIGQNQPSPRILHLATHGFFFPDPEESEAV